MDKAKVHSQKVKRLQEQLHSIRLQKVPIALRRGFSRSHTTRSQTYKTNARHLDFKTLDQVIHVDSQKRIAWVEPGVTMEKLVKATLSYGLIPPVVPEFKGITVGGAIMGGAAESGSHRWGSFNDACSSYEILCGDGTVLHVSADQHPDLFYGISCSYGSLGALLSARVQLVPAQPFVHLRYSTFSKPKEAISFLHKATGICDFLDGIAFANDKIVIVEGSMTSSRDKLPLFKPSVFSPWYFQHVKELNVSEETMLLQDYLFRYDRGAFWMGAYLFRPALLARFLGQGVLRLWKSEHHFTEAEVEKLHCVPNLNLFLRAGFHPAMTSKNLWKLLHLAEKWVQERMVIQDFCIPEGNALPFFEEVLKDPGIFPLWLCPIKGTRSPQVFAPHVLGDDGTHVINVGIYGIPSYFAPIAQITRGLEKKARAIGGKKVLYSRSYYTLGEFWEMYSKKDYDALRKKTFANGAWLDITEKVLSE